MRISKKGNAVYFNASVWIDKKNGSFHITKIPAEGEPPLHIRITRGSPHYGHVQTFHDDARKPPTEATS